MAYSTISKPELYFNTKLYTGDGSTSNSITGVGFQPDWIWIKKRNSSASHRLVDSIRGVQKHLASDNTNADVTQNSVMSFDTDGFTVGDSAGTNGSSDTFASWNWLASGSTASNSDGSINSTVSVNTTAGFSIVSYTGTGSAGTIGHGLGAVPKWYFVKRRDAGTSNWHVYHAGNAATQDIRLNLAEAAFTTDIWNDTAPTSTVFNVKTSVDVNASSGTYIAYCFAEKKGFSKFGSYTGNGNADGTFVYTGFKPAWVMIKCTSHSGNNWVIVDNKREGFNPDNDRLYADSTTTESDTDVIDLLSNGFKNRFTGGTSNGTSKSYIYMAFAEEPLVANVGLSIPATAR